MPSIPEDTPTIRHPDRSLRNADRASVIPRTDVVFSKWNEPVAQLVEHRPFKALVLGSSPSGLTIPALRNLPVPKGRNAQASQDVGFSGAGSTAQKSSRKRTE